MKAELKRFGGHFLYGLLTLLPLMVTFALLGWFGIKIYSILGANSLIGRALSALAEKYKLHQQFTLVISYILAILLIALFGYMIRRYAKIRFQDKAKKTMEHFPVVSTIYNTVEQIVGYISNKDENLGKFGEVVIVQYANMKILGLLASRMQFMINGKSHLMIFFPSTPMPATGFNYMIPIEDVYGCDLSFEEMSKIIFSLGALAHEVLGDEIKTHAM
jgi:uncharacterized membrane protein